MLGKVDVYYISLIDSTIWILLTSTSFKDLRVRKSAGAALARPWYWCEYWWMFTVTGVKQDCNNASRLPGAEDAAPRLA